MGVWIVFFGLGVPCLIFVILCAIPKTRKWMLDKGIL